MSDLAPELLINLDPAIEHPKGKFEDSLQLREPTALDVMKALKDAGNGIDMNHNMIFSLIVSVSGLQKQVIEKLPIRKFQEAGTYLMGFLGDSQATTEN